VLQFFAACCSVLQCVVRPLAHAGGLTVAAYLVCLCVAVCCSALQCVAVCCSVLQCIAVCCSELQCVAVCCSTLQCVAARCSVLHCVAVCCIVLHTDLEKEENDYTNKKRGEGGEITSKERARL